MEQTSQLHRPHAGPSTGAPANSLCFSLSGPECCKHQPTPCATQIRLQRAGKACSRCTEHAAHWAPNWRFLLWNMGSSVENGKEKETAGRTRQGWQLDRSRRLSSRNPTPTLAELLPLRHYTTPQAEDRNTIPQGSSRRLWGPGPAPPRGRVLRPRLGQAGGVREDPGHGSAGAAFGPRPSPGGWGRGAPAVLRGQPQTR